MSRARLAAVGLVAMIGLAAGSLARAQDGGAPPPAPGNVVATATNGAAHVAVGAVHAAGTVAGQAVNMAGTVAKSAIQTTANILNSIF